MNIAVDAFPLTSPSPAGIPNYVRKVLLSMASLYGDDRYLLYCKNPFPFQWNHNLEPRFGSSTTEHSTSYGNTLWLFTKGVRMMKKDGADVLWGTRQMLPFYTPKRIRKILTMHDLVWRHYPKTMEPYGYIVLRLVAERSVRTADHIIAVSHATARSLVEVLGVPEEKITVVHLAADQYTPLNKNESAEYISRKYGTDRQYALTVSTIEPRKNLRLLLEVFSQLSKSGLQLLVAGASGWKTTPIFRDYVDLGLSDREVKFLGYVPDEDMNRLYSGARLFVFPSLYEGFGMPPLEAMASGTPAIVSNVSAMPEVAGDAGLLLRPHDAEEWREAIARVVSDSALLEEMRKKGIERARQFSWEKAARKTAEVFRRFA